MSVPKKSKPELVPFQIVTRRGPIPATSPIVVRERSIVTGPSAAGGSVKRVVFEVPLARQARAVQPAVMGDNAELVNALREFTLALAGDRIGRNEQHARLVEALGRQR